jgi:hypothetical protein
MILSWTQMNFSAGKLYNIGFLVGAEVAGEMIDVGFGQRSENMGKRFIIVLKLKFQGRLPHKMLQHVLNSIPLKREC